MIKNVIIANLGAIIAIYLYHMHLYDALVGGIAYFLTLIFLQNYDKNRT